MALIDKLERKFGQYAISNLTKILIGGQILLYIYITMVPSSELMFMLIVNRVMTGQWWRLITFIFLPIDKSPLFVVFTWYIYYIYGSALEREWGSFRYMVYIFVGLIMTIIAGILFPANLISNIYIFSTIFLAFAYLYPDFTLLLFFIIPVKVKWISYLVWIWFFGAILFGSTGTKILSLLSLGNFLMFFGSEILSGLSSKAKRIPMAAKEELLNSKSYMTCAICKSTEKDRKIFYYCHKCIPEICYCEDHIKNHHHKNVN
jgi:membrane associated rhomboid family serine protease